MFSLDEALAKDPRAEVEAWLGEKTPFQVFFVPGFLRENLGLIFPFLERKLRRRSLVAGSS